MKSIFQRRVYVLEAKRTPFGSFLGALAQFSATDLGVLSSKACLAAAKIAPRLIDQVVFGNVLQTSKDAIYLARHIGLRCEIPIEAPALNVNRLCGSGFEAIIQGARLISNHEADCVLVGGTESMSQAPHVIRGARMGLGLKGGQIEDSLWESLTDTYINASMAITAENLADHYGISQDEVDEYSLKSQHNYQRALSVGGLKHEISPVTFQKKHDLVTIFEDEHPRKEASMEALKKLPKVFKKDGVIHAGAASGIADGASSLLLCSEEFLGRMSLLPLGELVSFGITGCDPKMMGIGPKEAILQCLAKVKMQLTEMSMIEVNEAFAPQVLAVKKELNINGDKLNINGGAIAIGHPLGASGARIATHLLHSMKAIKGGFGLGSACIGGGQGIAVLIRSGYHS